MFKLCLNIVGTTKMNEEQAIRELEKKGYFIEEQPKYKITSSTDEDFLIETDDLIDFYKSIEENE